MPTVPIGTKSPPRRYRITEEAVARFVAAIPRVIADSGPEIPPTFPVTLAPDPIPGLDLPPAGLIHGAQTFTYGPALAIGEEVEVVSEVTGFRERGGTRFLTVTTRAINGHGALAFEAEAFVLAPVENPSS